MASTRQQAPERVGRNQLTYWLNQYAEAAVALSWAGGAPSATEARERKKAAQERMAYVKEMFQRLLGIA